MLTLLHGDCTQLLSTLAPHSVQAIVTSPPYWGLRDYGIPPTLWPAVTYTPMPGLPAVTISGCAPTCDHAWGEPVRTPWANSVPGPNGIGKNTQAGHWKVKESGAYCIHCGGWRGCLGLEPDPHMFIAHLVYVFRLAWPVLRDDGVVWLNLGDSYAGSGRGMNKDGTQGKAGMLQSTNRGSLLDFHDKRVEAGAIGRAWVAPPNGYKQKDLVGIPWMVAKALQADGWYLRSDVIWAKPNAMPESVTDRPTKAHEYIFLLTKSERYYYDSEAIAEHATRGAAGSRFDAGKTADHQLGRASTKERIDKDTRNRRSVWSIPTQANSFSEECDDCHGTGIAASGLFDGAMFGVRRSRREWAAFKASLPKCDLCGGSGKIGAEHFATFPDELAELCILASSAAQACEVCGAPWERLIDVSYINPGNRSTNGPRSVENRKITAGFTVRLEKQTSTIGWQPTCTCENTGAAASCVLDMFGGSGTVGRVAERLGRHAVLIDLNPDYLELQQKRTDGVQKMITELL